MNYKQRLLAVALGAWLFAPFAVHGEEVEDLQVSFDRTIAAYNARDLDALVAGQPDHLLYFGPLAPSSVAGQETARQAFATLFATYEQVTFTPFDTQFRVSGTTGVAWGFADVKLKPENGPPATAFFHYTWNYAKVDGKWLRVP
jgi:ketosteroid isomerase-like protein